MKWLFLGIFFILSSLFLLEYHIVGQAVYGDGRFYWSFTRSMYFSHNIDISDEMGHVWSPEENNQLSYIGKITAFSGKTKEITKSFSLGMSVIWLPFYVLADVVVIILSAIGIPMIRNGYSDPYQIVVGLGNILFVTTGLYLLSKVLSTFYSRRTVILTLLVTLFATNLLYYGGIDVINSHPLSFLLSCLLVYLFSKEKELGVGKTIFLLGIILGLMTSNRTQDALFIVIPLSLIWRNLRSDRKRSSNKKTTLLQNSLLLGAGGFLGYLPQLLIVSIGQGHLSLTPHTDQPFSYPRHMLQILFDTHVGVFWYMPIFLIGVGGLFLLREKIKYKKLFLGMVCLQFLLISSWDAWQQAAYTMRYFISVLPFIAFGIAEVIERLKKRRSPAFLSSLVAIFILHQLLMILMFKLFVQYPTDVGGEISRSGQLKVKLLQQLHTVFK